MEDNTFEAQYNVSKKSKLRKFYDENKLSIFSAVLILVIIAASLAFYSETKERKRIILTENYINAKIYIDNGQKDKAKNILKTIVFANDSTYSVLSLFLILNQNLIVDQKEMLSLFDHILANNKFEQEIENLIIFKKILYQSNFVSEQELLESTKSLINTETLWKPHALLLLGDYFVSKKEYLKAREFYVQVLSLENLHIEMYDQARRQLGLIIND